MGRPCRSQDIEHPG